MLTFANVVWGARCGESARRVLLGETRSRGYAYSVRLRCESALEREAPHGLPSSRLVSTIPFDMWMVREFSAVPFERYADDALCHCRTLKEAEALRTALEARLAACRLVLHPQKTKIVYCQDTNRRGTYAIVTFDFLGFTFRPRLAAWRGGLFGVSFLPAASNTALKAIRRAIRGWSLQTRTDKALDDLARMYAPYIRGWVNYYGQFYKSALIPSLRRIDVHLLTWARHKFKRLRQRPRGARLWFARVVKQSPMLFVHWSLLYRNDRTLGAV